MICVLHGDLLRDSFDSFEEGIELILKHLFDSEEVLSDLLMEIMIGRDNLLCFPVGIEEKFSDFLIDEILGLI